LVAEAAGNQPAVQVKRLIRRHIRRAGSGIDLAADVNAVLSVNLNERRQATSSKTSTKPPPGGLDTRGREQP
jgi:hypothetical protein